MAFNQEIDSGILIETISKYEDKIEETRFNIAAIKI